MTAGKEYRTVSDGTDFDIETAEAYNIYGFDAERRISGWI